jgi:hypothetical protein
MIAPQQNSLFGFLKNREATREVIAVCSPQQNSLFGFPCQPNRQENLLGFFC